MKRNGATLSPQRVEILRALGELAKRAEATGDGVGNLDDEAVRAAYLLLHRAESRAASGRTRLGLDPLSRAKLGRDVAQGAAAQADTAKMMAQLADLERRGMLPPDQGDGAGDPA